jgi:hypothetical protein
LTRGFFPLTYLDNAPRGTRRVLRPWETSESCSDIACLERLATPPAVWGWARGGSPARTALNATERRKNRRHRPRFFLPPRPDPPWDTGRRRTASGAIQRRRGSAASGRAGGIVPRARAGLLPRPRQVLDGNDVGLRRDGRMVDALALAAEEGRGHAAKCPGETLAVSDPGISEWGNPPGARPGTYGATRERAPGELKHLSTPRNREDSLSSGERTGRSPNPAGAIACRRCLRGVERVGWRGRQPPRGADTFEPKTAGTGHRRG